MALFAHSSNAAGQRQGLVEHLRGVARRAERFADAFGAGGLGHRLGLWHDVGKFNPAWQAYLAAAEAEPRRARAAWIDHKRAGALLAAEHDRTHALSLLILGHHGGLPAPADLKRALAEAAGDPAIGAALEAARRALPQLAGAGPVELPVRSLRDPLAAELLLRLLFSALVDADALDTEGHFTPELGAQRTVSVSLAELWTRFQADGARRFEAAADSAVNRARAAIYRDCLEAAPLPPGIFRLAAPTGGGKTRSSMAFALAHALHHGQERVIVALPYISVTEQTAAVYREAFGEATGVDGNEAIPVVLEHHSAADALVGDAAGDDPAPTTVWARLAAQNWEAPVVVTTTVQLFESLFAAGPGRCRKVHRLARSVIVLDEAQALPPRLLRPILDVLCRLCTDYGTTVVIATATQPAFEAIPEFAGVAARTIGSDPAAWFAALRRVRYEWRIERALTWAEMAALVDPEPQALAILNRKADALALLAELEDASAFHLSTLLCGAHRRAVLAEVRERLAAGAPCRVIATQVIEAGVDVDFPFVLRALGPLDSIIQAAGRCNREGRLRAGRVLVVEPAEGGLPPGEYRAGTHATRALLAAGPIDPDDPAVARRYFELLLDHLGETRADAQSDGREIQALRQRLDFPEVAARFRLIDDDTESVIITTWGGAAAEARVADCLEGLRRRAGNPRALFRQLQPYTVAIRRREAQRLRAERLIEPLADRHGRPVEGYGIWRGEYDARVGLRADRDDLERFVV